MGAGDRRQAALYTGNTVTLFMALSLVLTAMLLLLRQSITGRDVHPGGSRGGDSAYLTVCFLGIPFITAYNIISSIFRGLGDSKSPMYFIAIACGANIALDYFFMGALHLGPGGRRAGHHAVAGCQRGDLADCDSPAPNRNFRHSRRPPAPAGR